MSVRLLEQTNTPRAGYNQTRAMPRRNSQNRVGPACIVLPEVKVSGVGWAECLQRGHVASWVTTTIVVRTVYCPQYQALVLMTTVDTFER
jgi:hypothetical protein